MKLKDNKAAQFVKKNWKIIAYTSAVVVVTAAITKSQVHKSLPLLVGSPTDPVFFGVPKTAIDSLRDGVGGTLTYRGNFGTFDIVVTPPAK